MWEEMLNEKELLKVIEKLGEDATEDLDTMKDAVEYLSANVEFKDFIGLTANWNEKNSLEQVDIVFSMVDEEYASKFMILIDHFSERVEVESVTSDEEV